MENPIKITHFFGNNHCITKKSKRFSTFSFSHPCTDSCTLGSLPGSVWLNDASRSKGIQRHQGSYFWTVGARLSGPEQIRWFPKKPDKSQVVVIGNQEGFFWRTLGLWNTPIFVRLYCLLDLQWVIYTWTWRHEFGWLEIFSSAFLCVGFSAFPLPDDCGARNVVPVPMGVRKTQDAFGKRVGGSGRHLPATTGTTHCWSSW